MFAARGGSRVSDYQFLQYETFDEGTIVRILLDRPDARNAQNRGLLVELDEAMRRAEADDTCRVVILGGTGPLFSSGHDMGSKVAMEEYQNHPTTKIDGGTREGAENQMLQEWHYYFENTLRWRNLRKITIAQVQGSIFSAGLMLLWSCDLIVGADDAVFADVVGTRLGMCGLQ
jgi:enoyl-CoA hydratase